MKTEYLSQLKNKKNVLATSIVALILLAAGIGFVSTSFNNSTSQEFATTRYADATSLDRSAGSSAHDTRKKAASIRIELRTEDVFLAEQEITALIEQSNGYITSNRVDRRDSVSGTIVARIPSSNSSNFISQIEEVGKIESRRTNVDDVTDQYSEIETELRNRKQELNRLEELLNQTDKVSELVEVEERLSTVRSRIDYLEQRKARLDTRIDYDEVTIEISEPTLFNTGFEPKEAVSDAYRGFFNSLTLIIVGLGYLLPLALIGLTGYICLKAWRKLSERF